MAKQALCIGINDYPGTDSDLQGCVNDANDWSATLTERGFQVTSLLDKQATKAAIVEHIQSLLNQDTAGDQIVITFSGHGTWLPDEDSDEPDHRDEALCTYDLANGPLLDDDLFELFNRRHLRTRLILISDSCHSGTVARYARLTPGDRRVRYLPMSHFVSDRAQLIRARSIERAAPRARARLGALLMAGAQDSEYSWDTSFEGRPNGAFTRVALDALRTLSRSATYSDWQHAIRSRLPSADYPQSPNLVGTATQKRWPVFG
jgi:metacaspase-1